MLNEKVCRAYVNNTYERRHTVARWQEVYEAMPIGVPLTATEIAERANENRKEHYAVFSHHNIPPMARAMGLEVIKREKVAVTPYEVEIEVFDGWDINPNGGVVVKTRVKKIVVDHKTLYTRLV